MRLRTASVPGATLAVISLLFFLHCSKVRIPPLGGVKMVSGLTVDIYEIRVVRIGE